jgi:lipopolysaccharide biosynthesis protein
VAFYLPQFHEIPENDEWWGDGFTEWRNVRRAQPQFDAHRHPRVPADLGYYDLSDVQSIARQSQLSRDAGIDAWCVYFYWFDHKRLLETPLDLLVASDIQQPFCLSWANENWTRRWDGKSDHVLMAQRYRPSTAEDVFLAWLPYLRDRRYLRQAGKPIVVIHKVQDLPDARAMADDWRGLAARHGLQGVYLVAAETTPGLDPRRIGFDALAEFPPVGSNDLRAALPRPPRGLRPGFRGRIFSYSKIARAFVARRPVPFVRHRGVMPSWDNTARRGAEATVYVGSVPQSYQWWLRQAIDAEAADRGGEGLVFINAWNEWAERAYLEPDSEWGTAWLEATRGAIEGQPGSPPAVMVVAGSIWHRGHVHSLAMAAASSLRRHARVARDAVRGTPRAGR